MTRHGSFIWDIFFQERERLNLTLSLLNSRPRVIFRYVSGMIFFHTLPGKENVNGLLLVGMHAIGNKDLPKQGFCTPRPERLAEGNLDGRGGAYFYRTRVRSLVMLVTDSLTDSLTHSCLVAVNDTNCLKMSQQPLKAVKGFLRSKKFCKLSTFYKDC